MDTIELRRRVEALDYKALGHHEYRREQAALETQWKAWLEAQYLAAYTTAVREAVWAKAWEEGHSEGYERVAAEYEDIADLVKLVSSEEPLGGR